MQGTGDPRYHPNWAKGPGSKPCNGGKSGEPYQPAGSRLSPALRSLPLLSAKAYGSLLRRGRAALPLTADIE